MDDVFAHLYAKIKEAPLELNPSPHFFISSLFPEDFYQELLLHLPAIENYQQLSAAYDKRFILPLTEEGVSALPFSSFLFWSNIHQWLTDPRWMGLLVQKFFPQLQERFGESIQTLQLSAVLELLRDFHHYSIGPHTDHPIRAITLLFYFPKDASKEHLGTSFYIMALMVFLR
jgi:hypothetical protein